MATNEPTNNALRLTFVTVLVIGLFLALFSRLWFLQILAGDRYTLAAEENRVRSVLTEAPRGRILDANGAELVGNRPALTISADRMQLLDGNGDPLDEDAERVLDRLSALLRLERDEIIERLVSRRYSIFRPIPIAIDVAPEIVYAVREQQELFSGVVAETLPVRTYPQGQLAAHLVGYLGEISEEELTAEPYAGEYRPGEFIGRGGLEQTYEPDLRGEAGSRRLEVNRQNRVVGVLQDREPVPGGDLVTSIDLDLQEATERLLAEGIVSSRSTTHVASGRNLPSTAGSAVVLDATDGAVLAMASFPTFDPREFVGGVSQRYWDEVTSEDNEFPLLNRPIQSAHPPGSVFKTVTGAAFMAAGRIGPQGTINCAPAYDLGGITFRNWNRGVNEGPMNLSTALMRSCDTYFYELAYDQWRVEQSQGDDVEEVLPIVAGRFGFGRTLGIDLPSERAGVIPSREWRREFWLNTRETYCRNAEEMPPGFGRDINADLCVSGGTWRGGDAINSSIGQGDVLTTPLQIAASYMAIANGGTLWRPHLGQRIVAPDGEVIREIEPESLGDLGLDDAELRAIQEGLRRVVMEERGTAHGAFTRGNPFPLSEIPVAGKTGTAELKPKVPFAWFAAYAPADDPEIVVVVNVEQGGGGSQTAAPIARNILEHYFGVTDAEDAEFVEGDRILD
ncbi:penicillin-binding protein 2 [Nitriliruptor alkaliphilus]|uniref:penicillin-binding protein 2 n=1 Tax=Nitriliruptor alkaliphilus TaxID=427918 RepID=UPI000698EDF0|nr:penicillin-binding protein 2 [Nitriliruptor alkaliphilus]